MQPQLPLELPDLPAESVRIGWAGFALALPETWSLSFHSPVRSMTRQGVLIFSDLRGAAFEVRWQTPHRLKVIPADPRRALEKSVAKLRRRGTVETLDGAFLLRRDGLLLAADECRLFELHCRRTPERLEGIARDFLICLKRLARGPWLWSIYGIHSWQPASATLRQLALRAGDCRLVLGIPRGSPSAAGKSGGAKSPPGTVTVAALSLARQILRGRTLRRWASDELAFIRKDQGAWEESECAAIWQARTRRLGRTTGHQVEITLDAARNRIHWTHVTKSGK